ncbi:hypothetical protein ES703_119896 [subsurface metagenome]
MPRKAKAPEYNKPEIDYIIKTYGILALKRARERLCQGCSREDCLLLPLTTEGEDCPYFALKLEVPAHDQG